MKILIVWAALLSMALPIFGQASDAAMFRGGPQHPGVYDGVGVTQLKGIKWKFKTQSRVYSSPAEINGVVYFGSTDHNLYAVDANDGSLKWKFESGSLISRLRLRRPVQGKCISAAMTAISMLWMR